MARSLTFGSRLSAALRSRMDGREPRTDSRERPKLCQPSLQSLLASRPTVERRNHVLLGVADRVYATIYCIPYDGGDVHVQFAQGVQVPPRFVEHQRFRVGDQHGGAPRRIAERLL